MKSTINKAGASRKGTYKDERHQIFMENPENEMESPGLSLFTGRQPGYAIVFHYGRIWRLRNADC